MLNTNNYFFYSYQQIYFLNPSYQLTLGQITYNKKNKEDSVSDASFENNEEDKR